MNMWKPVYNAAGAALYITLVVKCIDFISSMRHNTPDTLIDGMGALSLLVFSAATMAFLFFYRPVELLIDGRRGEAISYFMQTLAFFGAITIFVLLLVSMQMQ